LEFFYAPLELRPALKSFMANEITVYFSRMDSPAGPLLLAATEEKGLRLLNFDRGKLPPTGKDEIWIESSEHLKSYVEQVNAYFRGELRNFTCKLDLIGTEFQKDCWKALLQVPYGKTCSYGDIARAIGRPLASRAVGMANHDNPIAIIVPCHRIVGANGTLTGYGGGLSTKEKLLRLEGADFRVAKPSPKAAREEVASQQASFEY
jgi:methylated-DNA-[protein]-cysteine S-methyltransferase